jgi:cation diffusion facilitator family transporter
MASAVAVEFSPYNLPPKQKRALHRAVRIEWITLAAMLSIVVVITVVMGQSQTMKAMWVEDILSLIPSVVFLLGVRFRDKPADATFPYGYRRVVSVAYLCSAVALFALGCYILIDSIVKLLLAEHPTINSITVFGHHIWLGWLMIGALVYSAIPPFVLGRLKEPLARELHEKTLQTQVEIAKGDWLSGLAGVLGLLGIAYGFWWADAVAAGVISFEIVKDGVSSLRNSVAQLMNKRPSDVVTNEPDPIVDKVREGLRAVDWVKEVRVRLREDGDVLTGEAFVVPKDECVSVDKLEEVTRLANSLDWRLYDINVVPVSSLQSMPVEGNF